jgi:hypothetical protein
MERGLAHTEDGPIVGFEWNGKANPGSRRGGTKLGLAMMVMTMVAVMRCCGKRRTSEHHHQEHSGDKLFHGMNVARLQLWKGARGAHESNEETSVPERGRSAAGVNWGQR